MRLDWMLFAKYAEDNDGLLYISGGGWDTVTVGAPFEGDAPPGTITVLQGTLVIRTLFHITETGRDHSFAVTILDEDGSPVGKVEGSVRVDKRPGLPPGWDQNVNFAIPLGVPLQRFGLYSASFQVNGQHLGDRPFRVLKGY